MTHPPPSLLPGPDAPAAIANRERPSRWTTGLIAFVIVGGLWTFCLQHPVIWRATGIGETSVPFLDLYGTLAAGDVARAGGDPFALNPLDPYHRPHIYATWWLVTADAGLTRADVGWLGWALLGVTLLAAITSVRPQTRSQALQTVLLLGSPAILMAVNRTNNDLVIFALIAAALGLLRAESTAIRGLAAVLLASAAVLKYYPLATVVVLLTARSRREGLVLLALFGAVLVAAWPAVRPGLHSAARFMPQSGGLYAFGAPTIFREFGVTSPAVWLALAGAVGAGSAWLALRRRRDPAPVPGPDTAPAREFACAAVLITGCFFLGASYVYKLIFAAWLLPWLWRAHAEAGDDRGLRFVRWLLFGVLWVEGLMAPVINLVITPRSPRVALQLCDVTLVIAQLLTWALIAALLQFLVGYVVDRLRFLRHDGGAAPARLPA